MLIYVDITDRRTDRQTHQKYSSEPHKTGGDSKLKMFRIDSTILMLSVIEPEQISEDL